MRRSRFVLFLALSMGILSLTASAHGGCHKPVGERGYPRPDLCSVYDCQTRGIHQHGVSWYRGHYIDDDHDWHEICDDPDCTLTTLHEHEGSVFSCYRQEVG